MIIKAKSLWGHVFKFYFAKIKITINCLDYNS